MTSENRCPDCGAQVRGGREGCQALWDEISVRAYGDARHAATRDLAFDAYCMQHPERYCRSAKSYAAHLTRLCCGLEFGGAPEVYAAINRWLNGKVPLDRPEPPGSLGHMTVADLYAARDGAAHVRVARAWAADVWAAYTEQHELARRWIATAQADGRR